MSKSKEYIDPVGSDFDEDLDKDLKDPVMAAYFINAAMAENDFDYLKVALGRVARVFGVKNIAKQTKLGRESIYKMLAEDSNPGLSSIQQILDACGLELVVKAKLSKEIKPSKVGEKDIIIRNFATILKGVESAAKKGTQEALSGKSIRVSPRHRHTKTKDKADPVKSDSPLRSKYSGANRQTAVKRTTKKISSLK